MIEKANRILVVGDVHGCLTELQELLEKLKPVRGRDKLVFLGDLIDRGPDPVGVVKFCRTQLRHMVDAEFVLGNHEEKFIRWAKHEFGRGLKKNPVPVLSEEREAQWRAMLGGDVIWMRSWPLKLQLDSTWWAVHAGFMPGDSPETNNPGVVRLRFVDSENKEVPLGETYEQPKGTIYWSEKWTGPSSVVYGHAVHSLEFPRMDVHKNTSGRVVRCVGIDTGCVFGGKLTCMVISSGDISFVSVNAHRKYRTLGEEPRYGPPK